MICELCNGDWIFGGCFVSDLDLSLEVIITWPLTSVHYNQNMSHATIRGWQIHTRMQIWVVDFPPRWACIRASRRVLQQPLAASLSEIPKMPSEFSWTKKMGSCSGASATYCLASLLLLGDHSDWGTTVPMLAMPWSISQCIWPFGSCINSMVWKVSAAALAMKCTPEPFGVEAGPGKVSHDSFKSGWSVFSRLQK